MSTSIKIVASLVMLVALLAAGVAGYLAYQSWQGSAAVCTAEAFDCDTVLTSPWSRLLGLPVAALGAAVYLAIAVLVWPAASAGRGAATNTLVALATAALGAGIWFTAVQWFGVQSFCPYCLVVHGCGLLVAGLVVAMVALHREPGSPRVTSASHQGIPALVAARREPSSPWPLAASAGAGVAGLVVLIALQQLLPHSPQALEEIELSPISTISPPVDSQDQPDRPAETTTGDDSTSAEGSSEKRLVSIAGLAKPLDLSTVPVLGDPAAPHVMVEMMDYTCSHCRQMYPRLEAARERYGDQLAIALMPTPLHEDCNDHMPPGRKGRIYSCDYAKLALAVWQLAPDEFEEYHGWLLTGKQPPPVSEARQRALDLAGERVLVDQRLKDRLTKTLRQNTAAWVKIDPALPLLLLPDAAMRGGGGSNEELFEALEQKLGVEPAAGG